MSFIHGDLNGANILIDGRDNVWLIDFFHTRRAHVLMDLLKMENDLLYIFTPVPDEQALRRAFALTVQRASDGAKAGHKPGPESSLFKVYGTELNMRRHELMVRIAGPQALGWEGDGFEDEELVLTRTWLRSICTTGSATRTTATGPSLSTRTPR